MKSAIGGMTVAASALGWMADERTESRDAVHHRTRAIRPDGRLLPLLIVNTSQGGLMARCDLPCEEGDRLRIDLPHYGQVLAEVRWCLGGRLGCRFERSLDYPDYHKVLAGLRR